MPGRLKSVRPSKTTTARSEHNRAFAPRAAEGDDNRLAIRELMTAATPSMVGGGMEDGAPEVAAAEAPALTSPPLLALPAPEDASSSINLDVSTGQPVTLDRLGPVVVNADGTLARIGNWHDMTDREREVTQRRISKRNIERLAVFWDRGELKSDLVSALGHGTGTGG